MGPARPHRPGPWRRPAGDDGDLALKRALSGHEVVLRCCNAGARPRDGISRPRDAENLGRSCSAMPRRSRTASARRCLPVWRSGPWDRGEDARKHLGRVLQGLRASVFPLPVPPARKRRSTTARARTALARMVGAPSLEIVFASAISPAFEQPQAVLKCSVQGWWPAPGCCRSVEQLPAGEQVGRIGIAQRDWPVSDRHWSTKPAKLSCYSHKTVRSRIVRDSSIRSRRGTPGCRTCDMRRQRAAASSPSSARKHTGCSGLAYINPPFSPAWQAGQFAAAAEFLTVSAIGLA